MDTSWTSAVVQLKSQMHSWLGGMMGTTRQKTRPYGILNEWMYYLIAETNNKVVKMLYGDSAHHIFYIKKVYDDFFCVFRVLHFLFFYFGARYLFAGSSTHTMQPHVNCYWMQIPNFQYIITIYSASSWHVANETIEAELRKSTALVQTAKTNQECPIGRERCCGCKGIRGKLEPELTKNHCSATRLFKVSGYIVLN